jgi:hypothetical protein
MRLFHAVYVNGKISAVAGYHISDLIAGFIYYVYIFSMRICQLEPTVIHYALIVCVVATISTMLSVQFIFPKNVGSVGTWSMLLSGLLLVDFVCDSHRHPLLRTSPRLSRFIHTIITSRIIFDIRESMSENDLNCDCRRVQLRNYQDLDRHLDF